MTIFPIRRHFSEVYQRAFDAPWYKRAVDHHAIEPESFVFSVPFKEAGAPGSAEPLVLATHAVFIEHRGHRAPAGVVGLYYELKTLAKHFANITSTVSLINHNKIEICSNFTNEFF